MRAATIAFLVIISSMAHAESKSDPEGFGKRTVQLFDAMKAHDGAALETMLAPHFVFTTFVGTTGTRAQYIDVIAKKLMNIESYKLEPVGVEVYGDAAVVVYHLLIQAHVGDQAWPGHLISTDTWVKQGGAWKLAARHSSVVATQH
jgi:Domain of unknown function (DUF4440)